MLDAENRVAFLIEHVVGCIEILGGVLVIRHRTRCVSDDTIVLVPNRNHDTTAEEVELLVRFIRVFEQSHRLEQWQRKRFLLCVFLQAIPSIIGIAYTAFFDEVDTPTFTGVLISSTSFLVLVMDVRRVVLLNDLVGNQHGLTLFVLLLLFGSAFAGIFLDRDVMLLRKKTNGLDE